jgi:iron complex transport system permease protein
MTATAMRPGTVGSNIASPSRTPRRGALLRSFGLLASLGLLMLAVLLSLGVGSVSLPLATVVETFAAFDGSNEHLIVRSLRLPRTLIGLAVGASLAVAGVAMQAITRNALASPTILGINAGASFAIVTAVFVLGVVTPTMYVWFAFAGALGVSVLVYAIASTGRGGATPVGLALAGAVVTALLSSWISAILVFNQRTLDEVRFWLAGSLAGRDLDILVQVLPFLAIGLLTCLLLTPQFNVIALGDQVAAGLGQRTGLVRGVTAVLVVLLAGASVAVAGPIGFVGLAVPHAVRSVVGPDHRWLLPYAAIHGAVLLLLADVVGRVVMRPSEIQVGIITAIIGAPVLVHLVRRGRSVEL